MNDIPGINLFPEKWRGWIIIAAFVAPYLGRAYISLKGGGGLIGIWRAIMFGTNTDPKVTTQVQQVMDALQNGQRVTIGRDAQPPTTP